MNVEELIEGAWRIRKLNTLLAEMSIDELEYLYNALPSIIKFKNEKL